MGINAILPGQVLANDASVGDVLTAQADGSSAFQSPAGGGIGGSTGSTDNAAIRADGTGGSTLQSADWIMPDNYTASPNATVNVCALEATGATTNVGVAIVPQGAGAFSLHVPDDTTAGGNARGTNAVDLQTLRSAANQVASGPGAFAAGRNCQSSGWDAVAIGRAATATGFGAVAIGGGSATEGSAISIGYNSTSTSSFSVALGAFAYATNVYSFAGPMAKSTGAYATAFGGSSDTDRYGMRAFAAGYFTYGQAGEAQSVGFTLRNKTTGATATELFLDGSSTRLTIPNGKILHATVHVLGSKSDGSAIAIYQRQVAIANVGGTTSLVGSVNTIGSDTAASTSFSITADDTNDALKIEVTGIAAETWRWVASVSGAELAYGT